MPEDIDPIESFAELEYELEQVLARGVKGGLSPLLIARVLLDHRDEIKRTGEVPSYWR